MLHFSNILAAAMELAARRPSRDDDSSDTGWVKLVVIGIVLVIWAFSALAAAMKKANQKQRTLARVASPIQSRSPKRSPMPAMKKAMAPKQVRRGKGPPPMTPVRPAAAPPAAYPAYATAAPPAIPARTTPPRPRQSSTASAAPALTATAIRNWMKPEVMQQQFVLTELFDPPMSDR